MSKERYNQIVNEVFKKYADSHWTPPENPNGPLLSDQLWSLKPMQHSKESFIQSCKTDKKFSERWGLKIEEQTVFEQVDQNNSVLKGSTALYSRKLITVTYKDETIKTHE